MKFDIELARSEDAMDIAAMSRLYIEYGLKWRWKPRLILGLIKDPECSVIKAVADDGEILGFAAMEFLKVHAHLSLLAVKPEYRRHRVGHQLLTWLETSARVAGMDHVVLEVRRENADAVTFYEKADYEIARVKKGYYQGEEDAYQMIHKLISAEMAQKRPDDE